ncbi:unc45b [Symbiodinium sp. KB8]|nr:unc45b [Symbiodinium sp. KB8]
MVSAPAPLSSHQRVQVVLELKEKGNKALEAGNAAQAAEEYTLALLQLQETGSSDFQSLPNIYLVEG